MIVVLQQKKQFSQEQEILFKKDLKKATMYTSQIMLCGWLKHNHPETAAQLPPSSVSSSSSSSTAHSDSNSLVTHYSKSTESNKILDDLLVYPTATDAKIKGTINSG